MVARCEELTAELSRKSCAALSMSRIFIVVHAPRVMEPREEFDDERICSSRRNELEWSYMEGGWGWDGCGVE